MTILLYMVIIIGTLVGGGSTLAIIGLLFGTIGLKIYRRIRFGISLFD